MVDFTPFSDIILQASLELPMSADVGVSIPAMTSRNSGQEFPGQDKYETICCMDSSRKGAATVKILRQRATDKIFAGIFVGKTRVRNAKHFWPL